MAKEKEKVRRRKCSTSLEREESQAKAASPAKATKAEKEEEKAARLTGSVFHTTTTGRLALVRTARSCTYVQGVEESILPTSATTLGLLRRHRAPAQRHRMRRWY